ncbi:unnamed protein product [Linum trigynum]|uniref:Uncharacterized protein n=1 Tax=Linum trigynum TaxID=586398 RepID=A0AAV2FYR5_9ROSI
MFISSYWGGLLSFIPQSWEENLSWATRKFGNKSVVAMNGRLIWQAMVSHVWRERCMRAFGDQKRSSEDLIRIIKSEVCVLVQDPTELETFWSAGSGPSDLLSP